MPDITSQIERVKQEIMQEVLTQVESYLAKLPGAFAKMDFSGLKDALKGEMGPSGFQGIPGPMGQMPVPGVHFPIPKDGVPGRPGLNGRNGKDGLPGRNGKDISFNEKEIIKKILDQIPKPKDGISSRSSMRFGGGGDTISAGTGITVTTGSDGTKVITNSASSGTAVWNEVVVGATNTFTLANTPTAGTVRVYALGQRLVLTTDYTIAGAIITTVNAWSATQIIADYSY